MTSEQAVARLIEALEQEGVGYMLVGAYSSNLYGVPRATDDADVVIEFGSFNIVEFCRRLGAEFALDRQMMIEGFTGSVRNIVHFRPTGFDIEVFRLVSVSGTFSFLGPRCSIRQVENLPPRTAGGAVVRAATWRSRSRARRPSPGGSR